jgi:hypothetical protein
MNKFLEKVANALTRAISKGMVTSVSTVGRNGERLGAAALNKRLTGPSVFSTVRPEAMRRVIDSTGKMGMRRAINPARGIKTSDSLAQSTIYNRLAQRKSQLANGRTFTKPTKTVFGTKIPGSKTTAGPSTTTPSNNYLDKAKSLLSSNKGKIGVLGATGAAGFVAGRSGNKDSSTTYTY